MKKVFYIADFIKLSKSGEKIWLTFYVHFLIFGATAFFITWIVGIFVNVPFLSLPLPFAMTHLIFSFCFTLLVSIRCTVVWNGLLKEFDKKDDL